jgi:Domain of unknown function (DUF4194)
VSEPTDVLYEDDWMSEDDLDARNKPDFDDESEGEPGGSRLTVEARRALTTLLINRFVTRSRNRSTWDALLVYESEIRERLADMSLLLVIDKDYEVAFKRQNPAEDAPRMLRRDKPLHRDTSLLLIYLRKEHAYTDATDDPVVITRTQVGEFFRPFREDGDADEDKYERRVDAAIRAVTDLKLLTPDADVDYLFTVSPAVVPLIGADEMMRFEQYFVRATEAVDPTCDSENDETDQDSA